ncbi:glutathione S-transferase family protein [Halomonas binhaiensis]|uniref:Glutathione S-transferase family protein n=1 Tax=Halomonas binhaiensis TaxID=2562282 RepID=A0A5C1NI39_9GAMM|nr:glutathione S-transferase family protein [Halomonas binhaiensis]QEM82323.1 glutathione S-transferase family protein [Halomonas binhaiensis]
MYQLHIANRATSSWSLRPWVLMKSLQIPFNETLTPFAEEGGSAERFRRFSPTGKVPCLIDGEIHVWESLAIVEYLAERHGGVWPEDDSARAWARSICAEMHAGFAALRSQCPMCCGVTLKLKQPSMALDKDVQRIDEIFKQGLERWGGAFLCGDRFTAADAFFAPVALRAKSYGLPLSRMAQDYVERLVLHPPMQEWQRLAVAEKWREAGIETYLMEHCDIVEDLRASDVAR